MTASSGDQLTFSDLLALARAGDESARDKIFT
jgi:hypothetical protein